MGNISVRDSEESIKISTELIDEIKLFDCPPIEIGDTFGQTGYIDFITMDMVTHDVMKGTDCTGRPFFVVKAYLVCENKNINTFTTFFQRYSNEKLLWHAGGPGKLLMSTDGGMTIKQLKTLRDLLYNGMVCDVTDCRLLQVPKEIKLGFDSRADISDYTLLS